MTRFLYTQGGLLVLERGGAPDEAIDTIQEIGYAGDDCVAFDWSPEFVARLMFAGFLVMSLEVSSGAYILLPRHHRFRCVLFFNELHAGRTVRRALPHYELRPGDDARSIARECAAVHGGDWLTPPLLDCFDRIAALPESPARPFAFGLYRNGARVAGEFGVRAGRVYTSYSGYFAESGAGRAQMVLSARWLCAQGFAFWDLGMPLPYKYTLGARDIPLSEFVKRFRAGRGKRHILL